MISYMYVMLWPGLKKKKKKPKEWAHTGFILIVSNH